MNSRSCTNSKNNSGAAWQFSVGLALCAAAAGLIYLAGRMEAHANTAYLRELLAILNQYGGKWIAAGLVALLGLAFCGIALRRMRPATPDAPGFAQGTMHLESALWMKQARSGQSAGASTPAE